MGGCLSKADDARISPESATQDKHRENEETPVPSTADETISKSRSCTDVVFIILLAMFLVVLFVLLGYCMSYGDIYRIINGYDDCGNVCGRENTFTDDSSGCKGTDNRLRKYLRVLSSGTDATDPTQVNRLCVESCDAYAGYRAFLNRCMPQRQVQANSYFSKTGLNEFYQEVSEDLQACWPEILYLCLIAFVFSIVMMVMFRYMVAIVVWVVLIGVILICLAGTIFLWIQYSIERQSEHQDNINQRRTNSYLAFAIVATIITVIICLVIFVLRKRIQLVIELFKEAGKALSSMPALLFEPVLTFLSLALVVGLWLYFAIWIESCGVLTVENNASAKYIKDPTMKVTRWYNLLAMFWMSQFLIGCQHMVIAGAVATWFFTRNKSQMDSPIAQSLQNLARFHLGTVAFGSLLIAVVQLVRLLFKAFELAVRDPQNRLTQILFTCCQCCLGCFESILQYLTRNAYIETAIFGLPFCAAGRKAFSILSSNALRVFAINSVGDFVLLLGKAFVVAITVLIGMELIQKKEGVHHSWVPLLLAGLFAYLVSHCFMTVFEMTIDTIFICFCEDCDRNDGISRPYYMSRGLMQFVQNSKKALDIRDVRSGKAWSENVTPPPVKSVTEVVAT